MSRRGGVHPVGGTSRGRTAGVCLNGVAEEVTAAGTATAGWAGLATIVAVGVTQHQAADRLVRLRVWWRVGKVAVPTAAVIQPAAPAA